MGDEAVGVQRPSSRPREIAPEVAGSSPALGSKIPGSSGGRALDATAAPAEQPYLSEDELRERHGVEAVVPPDPKVGDEVPLRRVSPSKPIPPRVPFRRDVKPFQRGDK